MEIHRGAVRRVPLGVGVDVPRTPAVFEEKGRRRLAEEPEPGADAKENYKSVAPFVDQVRALFREEADRGWMRELPIAEARSLYGDRFALAPLEFTAVLGRLCFALGPLEHLRPFVAPL